jgi:uncharacterized SAM-dependent methyltransferase
MYAMSRVSEGIVLICQDCGHFEHVNQFDQHVNRFDQHIGSQRTQAVRAMQMHSHVMHDDPLLKARPQ